MIPKYLHKQIKNSDIKFKDINLEFFTLPEYDPSSHYLELTHSKYFQALLVLRHNIKLATDYYFSFICKATNMDLFMLTPSISSPMGLGSDSEAFPVKFGNLSSNLVDSSQFGFEPLLMNGFDKVYCYLPSMRGENPDKRHLNQFYHCELEMLGTLDQLTPIIENYISFLSQTLLLMPNILDKISLNPQKSIEALKAIIKDSSFAEISFEKAISLLEKENDSDLIKYNKSGRDITAKGELRLIELLNLQKPLWVRDYDRNRVPFYQKVAPYDSSKVINADLIFPSLYKGSFGGEIIGCGQRQDNPKEILESLNKQGIPSKSYKWYINLRNQNNYKISSGFGMGIERFITWSLCRDDIKDSIIYPRLKNIITYP
ncbi:MAG: hypothetical protein KAS02_02475 [Candidatus Pacebacteria bacterium]|nr:hypothetical protein [Candidatus Paceibacterota bacterium]